MHALKTLHTFVIATLFALVGLMVPRAAESAKAKPHPAKTSPAPPPSASAPSGEAGDDAPAGAQATPLPWKLGPTKIDLGHDLALDLKPEHRFLPPTEARAVLEKMGSFHNDNLLGLVASQADEEWFATLRYEPEGYIKDDDRIDGDEILSAIREGTGEDNKERVQKGFKAIRIDGWSDPPRYDKSVHHLVWALDVSDDEGKSVNYNTRILGRKGFVSINLVTAPERLAGYKPQAAALLSSTTFTKGARYEDFNEKTDKVAEYGLAGLVLGGAGLAAAKLVKVGLLAKFGKVIIAALIAGKKAIVAAAVAVVAMFKKVFGRKKESTGGTTA
jgi:uncharacterized membrane-anchored protein